jgi:hypothetical protein
MSSIERIEMSSSQNELAQRLNTLIGLKCCHVQMSYFHSYVLHFGVPYNDMSMGFLYFTGDWSLDTHGTNFIITEQGTSYSPHLMGFKEATEKAKIFMGQVIEDIILLDHMGLLIKMSNGLELAIKPDDEDILEDYPHWELYERSTNYIYEVGPNNSWSYLPYDSQRYQP